MGNRACLHEIEAEISQLQDELVSSNATTSRAEVCLASFPPPPSSYAAAASAGATIVSGSSGPEVTKFASAST